jgi:DNA-binding winged helix-turn-helix (wHTH) protein
MTFAVYAESGAILPGRGVATSVSAGPIKFGEFELDCDRYELLRAGRRLKMEKIPMDLLILLVAKNGHLVTRQEIVERLWGDEVFMDTDHGINTAIRKVRQALRDDPEQPRFVETVTGKGYRFIAEQNNGDERTQDSSQEWKSSVGVEDVPAQSASTIIGLTEAGPAKVSHRRTAAIAATLLCLLGGALVGFNTGGIRGRFFVRSPSFQIQSIAVLPLVNLSGDASQDYFADGMTDEVITALAKNHSLRVVSRTSAMQYIRSAPTAARNCTRIGSGWHSGGLSGTVCNPSAHDRTVNPRTKRHTRLGGKLRSRFE